LAFSALSFAFQHFIRYALLAHFRTLNIPITQENLASFVMNQMCHIVGLIEATTDLETSVSENTQCFRICAKRSIEMTLLY